MLHPKADRKLNYIIDYVFDMCDAPFSVYMRFLWPALIEAFIAYYALDMVQIFTRYVKPPGIYKGFRGAGHGQGKKKKRKPRTWRRYWQAWSSFDPSDEIGKHLPGSGWETPRPISPGVRTLWQLYDIQQRVAYWMMVYEISEEFFYTWFSGVAKSSYCQAQYRPIAVGNGFEDGNLAVAEKTPIVVEEIIKARHGASIIGNVARAPGRGSSCSFSARMKDPGIIPPPSGMKLLLIHSTGIQIASGDFGGAGSVQAVSGGTTAEGYWACYTAGPSNFIIDQVSVTVLGNENYLDIT